MDIGTNSVRLLVTNIREDNSYGILSEQKEMVRLGDGEFENNYLQPEVMDRCILVCSKLADLARAHGAAEIVAAATSASREAANQEFFLDRLREESSIDVRVVSGREEARLIYQGVSSGMNLEGKIALFIDIGGGSTELIVGGQRGYLHLDSLRLGALRISSVFSSSAMESPVSQDGYEEIKNYVRHKAARSIQRIRKFPFQLTVGSSGTIRNLFDVSARMFAKKNNTQSEVLSYGHLSKIANKLCSINLQERRKIPGLNAQRADIIIGGAAILEILMKELGIPEIRISDRTMRDGLLIDYISRGEFTQVQKSVPLRVRNVMQLARSFHFDESHARRVSRLAMQLFHSARKAGLHKYGGAERELLEYAALLHDIGAFLSYSDHHIHGYYFIKNAELLGFDQREIAIMAATVLFHRKGLPKPKSPECKSLDKKSLKLVSVLSVILRMAESLNRGHSGVVHGVSLKKIGDSSVVLEIQADQDCHLEVWGVKNHEKTFKKVFERDLEVNAKILDSSFFFESKLEEKEFSSGPLHL